MIPWWKADPAIETPPLGRSRLLSLVAHSFPEADIDPECAGTQKKESDAIQYILGGQTFFLYVDVGVLAIYTSVPVPNGIDRRRVLEYLYYGEPEELPALTLGVVDAPNPAIVVQCWHTCLPGLSDEQVTAILAHWYEVIKTFLHLYGQWIEGNTAEENEDKGQAND